MVNIVHLEMKIYGMLGRKNCVVLSYVVTLVFCKHLVSSACFVLHLWIISFVC